MRCNEGAFFGLLTDLAHLFRPQLSTVPAVLRYHHPQQHRPAEGLLCFAKCTTQPIINHGARPLVAVGITLSSPSSSAPTGFCWEARLPVKSAPGAVPGMVVAPASRPAACFSAQKGAAALGSCTVASATRRYIMEHGAVRKPMRNPECRPLTCCRTSRSRGGHTLPLVARWQLQARCMVGSAGRSNGA